MHNNSKSIEFKNTSVIPDIINTIALNKCTDSKHFIRFRNKTEVQLLILAALDEKATNVACHLFALGIRPHDRIGIMAYNCIEWVLLDLAVLKLGAVTAGFEPGRFDPEKIVSNYGLQALFADGIQNSTVFFNLNIINYWSENIAANLALASFHSGYDRSDICAIKFTSGSTGIPKGLEATVASVNSSLSAVQQMFGHGDGDNILIFLRLALLQQRYWIYSALVNGHDVTLANLDNVLIMAQETSPTVIMGVPRFYEDLQKQIEAADQAIHDLSVRQKTIQTLLGGHIRYLWTGSAPASRTVLAFFNDANVPLYEGYGLNETCIIAKNYPDAFRLGSVGKVLPNKKVRFDKDGILIVGSQEPVNCRYSWCAPGTNEKTFLPTAEVKTYDLGHIDEDGFLYIHGRVDDILTLSSGRNVLARLMEEKLRAHPDVHECVLFGNGKPFLSVVISLSKINMVYSSLNDYIKMLNATWLPEQCIHACVLVAEKFSIENSLLTSQFKPKRQDIHRRYIAELNYIYEANMLDCSLATDVTFIIADETRPMLKEVILK